MSTTNMVVTAEGNNKAKFGCCDIYINAFLVWSVVVTIPSMVATSKQCKHPKVVEAVEAQGCSSGKVRQADT